MDQIVNKKHWFPATDVFHWKDAWFVKMELAGIREPELVISATGNMLTVSGRRKDLMIHGTRSYQRLEIEYHRFHRSVGLPISIDSESICWHYGDGMLLIRLYGSDIQE